MRFLDFISTLDELTSNDLIKLNEFIELTVKDEPFIGEVCLPLVRGGKRLRPILFFLCAKSDKNYSFEKIMPLATAIELIHTASLVHDDILDSSNMRRGEITANAKYGPQIAVLAGDYLFAKAFQLVSEGSYGDKVSLILSKLVKNLCIGEITQDRSLFTVPSMTEYYERICLKTAIFLSSCCELGAIAANLSEADTKSLAEYGLNLGLAFQIVDDLLDFFGDPSATGKSLGGDLKSGVITLPVIRALSMSNESDTLLNLVTKSNISDSEVANAINIIKQSDSEYYCKMRANAHIDSAMVNLPDAIDSSIKLVLLQIADFVINRTW